MVQISIFTAICLSIGFLLLIGYCFILQMRNHDLQVETNLKLAYQKNQKIPTSREIDDARLLLQRAYDKIEQMRGPGRDMYLNLLRVIWNHLPEAMSSTKQTLYQKEYDYIKGLIDSIGTIHYEASDPHYENSSISYGLKELQKVLIFLHEYLSMRYINNAEPFKLPVDEQPMGTPFDEPKYNPEKPYQSIQSHKPIEDPLPNKTS